VSGVSPRRQYDIPPAVSATASTSDPFQANASTSFFTRDAARSEIRIPEPMIDIASWARRKGSESSGGASESSRLTSTGEDEDTPRIEDDVVDDYGPPIFNRTYSCPLPARVAKQFARPPSRLRQDSTSVFQTPALSDASGISVPMSELVTPSANHVALQTLSTELSDSLQSAIQTLLHLSPPHLLDNAKEQYSGCTVQMPTTSLSALLTAMKGLNYLSANVASLCEDLPSGLPEPISRSMPASRQSSMHLGDPNGRMAGLPSVPPPPPPPKTIAGTHVASELTSSMISNRAVPQPQMSGILDNVHKAPEDFDIGELLQSTADLLGGQSAQAGVEIVLFHGDVGIKHTSVSGDGEGLGYALSHVSSFDTE
jgi:osomolarity two-component system response regulator SSK1